MESFQSLLRRTLRESIRISLELASSPCRVRADRGQLEQVLLNLALNAQDAMPTGGLLRIGTSYATEATIASPVETAPAPDGYVRLSVQDNGCGQHIFEPFFTTKEKGKGTGWGSQRSMESFASTAETFA